MRSTVSGFGPSSILSLLALVLLAGCQSDEAKIKSFMENGKAYVAEGKHEEAVIEYRNVLQLAPNDSVAHYELARSYLALQKAKQAYWELSETVRLDPPNVLARVMLGGLLLMSKDYEGAKEQALAISELEPDHADAMILLGQAYEGMGQQAEAEPLYLRALETRPDQAAYIIVAASYYVRARNREAAEPLFVKYLEKEPGFNAYTALGRFLAEDPERGEETVVAFAKAAEFAVPENEVTAAHRNLASAYLARGRGDEAAATLVTGIDKLANDSAEKIDLMYFLARLYRGQGKDAESSALIEKAAEIQPNELKTHLVLSSHLGGLGDLAGALREAERCLEIAPDDSKANLRKAELLVDIGYRESDPAKIEEGFAIVNEVLAKEPTSPEALFVKGKVLLAKSDPKAAAEALRASVDGKPDWPQAHFVLGSALMLTGDRTGARAEMARAVELDPSLHEGRRMLTRLHAALGEHEYAVEQGRLYLRQMPDDTQTRILVAQSLVRIGRPADAVDELELIPQDQENADVLFAKGRLQQALGNQQEARRFLLAADAATPNRSEVLRALLTLDRDLGNTTDSVERIRKALEASPSDAGLLRLQGAIDLVNRDLEAAEATFKKAIEADPQDLEAYRQLANILQMTGRLDETLAVYQSALEQRPDSAQMHHFVGVLYESGGKVDLAKAEYEKAIALDDKTGQAKNNLAYLLAERGEDLDRALTLAQEAKALMPENPSAADTLGWVLFRRGIPSAAVGYLREAVAGMDPKSPSTGIVRHHLAQAYEANDQQDAAVGELESALAELEQQLAEARKAGASPEPPEWSEPVRAMLLRLKPAG